MKLQGTIIVHAPQEEVWKVLLDPVQLCGVLPGCEQAKQLDETHYEADFSVKVQFMTIRSHAKGTLLEIEEPRHMVGELVGEPVAMAGAFRALVTINLLSVEVEEVEKATQVQYAMELTMLGRLASLGEAIVRTTSQRLTRQFAENMSNLFSNTG